MSSNTTAPLFRHPSLDAGTYLRRIGREKGPVAIDLAEVMLVDRKAVRLFATSELNGIELRNCPGYIREWITKERESR
jgi:hypothetical protein